MLFIPKQLYMYDTLLRPLQGICVSLVIGAYMDHGGSCSLTMEVVDELGWRSTDSTVTDEVKRSIRHAYKELHALGILHGRVRGRNIIFGTSYYIRLLPLRQY